VFDFIIGLFVDLLVELPLLLLDVATAKAYKKPRKSNGLGLV
jgi:hypothetical protein